MLKKINIERARSETPGCKHITHFNNAGAALMPQPVLNAVTDYLQLEAMTGGYEAAEQSRDRIDGVYDSVARLVNGRSAEIALTENATRAWDMAFYAIPFQPGDRILTARAAYASNYIAFLQMARQKGVQIDVIPDDEHGQLSISALENMMDAKVKLIAITHMPTNGGLVNPAAAVGKIARAAGVLYLLDACQSVGQLPVDVEAIGCDILSATGRKWLRGPRGTGFLYVREAILAQLEPPMLDLHAAKWVAVDEYEIRPDARRFESWESSLANKIGLGVAIEYAQTWGIEAIWTRLQGLAQTLREGLKQIPGVTVQDIGQVQGGIITFTVDGMGVTAVKQALAQQKINVSTSTQFSTRLDMEARGLTELVRASVHYYNSEAEVAEFIEAINQLNN